MIPTIVMTDAPDVQTRRAMLRFNEQRAGRPVDFRPLALLLTHPETGETTGGLWGGTDFTQLHVDLLFVPETLRGSGTGRQLMRQAEEEAQRRGCRGAWLDTFSFQARGFYERLGYTVFGTIEDFPPGHSRFFMNKRFSSTVDPS
jgi:GNAT superfamily N-acetyltransferase